MRPLSVLFLIYALLELWLLIRVGSAVGALPVVLWVIASAVLGVMLLRRQGLSTLQRANERLQGGELPGREMLEGGLMALGAALLMAPGLVGDAVGLLCLLPPLRHWLVSRFVGRPLPSGLRRARSGAGPAGAAGPHHGVTIEGDYVRDDAGARDGSVPRDPHGRDGSAGDSQDLQKELPPRP